LIWGIDGGAKIRGHCKWFTSDRGYGFITGEDGQDYFVHYSEIIGQTGRRDLTPFATVEFEPEKNAKGLKATQVRQRLD
jgi:CspA family cold shock protein